MNELPMAAESATPSSLPPAKSPRIWGFWGTLIWSMVLFCIMVAASIPAVILYLLLTQRGKDISDEQLAALAGDGIMVGLGSICTMVPLVITVWIAIRIARHRFADYLCLIRPTGLQFAAGVAAILVLLASLDGTAWLTDHPLTPQVVIDALISARIQGALWFLVLAVLISAPVGEEIVFRGFIYRGLSESWLRPWGAVFLSALMFAVIHTQYTFYYLGEVFAIGLILGLARMLSGTTLLPMLMHMIHNAAALIQAHILSQ